MKSNEDIELLLSSQAAPKPKRNLRPDFTQRLVLDLRENPKPKRRPWWQQYLPFHTPATAFASIAVVVILSGTAYATTDGFTKLPSFLNIRHAKEQTLANGDRLLSIDTQDCKIEQWDETEKKLVASDRTYLYRLKAGSTMTADQVAQMLQGKCEFEAQTSSGIRQSALAAYTATHPADKNSLVGGYANEIITAITSHSLSTHGEVQYNGSLKKYDLTFRTISPDVIVTEGSQSIGWGDLRVGDSIAYVYRATDGALDGAETTPTWELPTNEATIVYVEKNSPNVRAYFDYTTYYGIAFEEVVPCQDGLNGYCAKYGPLAPPRTELDNSPASVAIQDAYMYLSNSYGQYINSTNPAAAKDLRRKFVESFTPELAKTIADSPDYTAALCGHTMTEFFTPQHAKQSGEDIVRDILFTSKDGDSFTVTLTANVQTNLITNISCG